jgi:hypothetical protein
MKLHRAFYFMLSLGFALAGARATMVIPPTFAQLVTEAELIFQGNVTDSHSMWIGQGSERTIVTDVTFQVEDVIKGAPGNSYTIRILGGTVGDETIAVSDIPKFKIGDRDILFIEHNGSQFVPLVGIMHGRFRIQKGAAGRDIVTKDNGAALSNVEKLGVDEAGAVTGPALSVTEFKAAIHQRLGY